MCILAHMLSQHQLLLCCLVLLNVMAQCQSLLRHEWTNRPLHSKVAQELSLLNQKCTHNKYTIYRLNNYGMGSSIGTSILKAACNSLEEGMALRTASDGLNWIWNDEVFCSQQSPPYDITKTLNPLQCYFGNVFTPCSGSTTDLKAPHVWWQQYRCPKNIPHVGNVSRVFEFQAGGTEYLFSQVNPAIVALVEEEAKKIFGAQGAPAKMITVHIRWGDKRHEMGGSLVPIDEYVKAVQFFVTKHQLNAGEVNIFLTTEDSHAAKMFKTHETVVSQKWTVFEYDAAISSNKEKHTPALDAKATKGKFGLISMVVLLLSMEAQYFVLTTASNWSVLMQSLVNSVVKQSGRDMDYIDLRRNPLLMKKQSEFNALHNLPMSHPYNDNGVLAFPIGSSIH